MSPQLLALLQTLEKEDLATITSALVPALFEEIQKLSGTNATVSALESVVFGALQPTVQSALASLIAKIPVVA